MGDKNKLAIRISATYRPYECMSVYICLEFVFSGFQKAVKCLKELLSQVTWSMLRVVLYANVKLAFSWFVKTIDVCRRYPARRTLETLFGECCKKMQVLQSISLTYMELFGEITNWDGVIFEVSRYNIEPRPMNSIGFRIEKVILRTYPSFYIYSYIFLWKWPSPFQYCRTFYS